ncbi:MAG: ankyrin repeat domain-containing protein [Actinomycetota bacterium]|nr:ankyrin repeat domain-containing protein [Actinomycetota bacterium]
MTTLAHDDPVAEALVRAIQAGDLASLEHLLGEHAGLARARIAGNRGGTRTPLHVVTDWPGYFPNGPGVVRMLIGSGADPDAPATGGPHTETPLHWAASSDDLEVADTLIDAGADLEAPGASIAGGPPLDDAVGYGCWHVARRLVERGARVDRLWHAAALGMQARVEQLLEPEPTSSQDELDHAFWQACHGGQRRMAQYLLGRGADVNWVPDYADGTPLDAAGDLDTRRGTLVTWLRERGAVSGRRPT